MSIRSIPPVSVTTLNRAVHGVNRKTGAKHNYCNTRYGTNPFDFLGYLARAPLIDLDSGKFTKGTTKGGLVESYCVTPQGCSWAADLQAYAQEVSEKDKRKNSRFGREFLFICPNGMKLQTFLALMRSFSFWLSGIYNTAPFVFIHDPKADTWNEPPETGRNLHAHVFMPTREIHPWGMGNKLYMLDYDKLAAEQIEGIREHWARELEKAFTMQNERVEFDHRSYERRGINKEAQPKIGPAAHAMHARGEETDRMKLFDVVARHNKHLDELEAEEKVLEAEIERLEALPNTRLPERCIGSYTIDDHVRQRSYLGTHAYAQRTYDWLTEHYGEEPMFAGLFGDFELLLDGPSPEDEKIPELPPEPTIGDLFESIAMWIDRLELRKRPRPHYSRKWEQQHGDGRSRSSPALVGPER